MNNSIELFVEHFSLYTKLKMTNTYPTLRCASHTQSYFYIKYRYYLRNFKRITTNYSKKCLYSK